MKRLSSGFTLIELLIVIAVLGILAVAVLSAINPIEQIDRSRDTGSRSDAEQLIGAIDRFYASQAYYPWNTSVGDTTTPVNTLTKITSLTVPNNLLTNLSTGATGELKTSFTSRVTDATKYNALWIYNRQTAGGDSTYVCFKAKSGAFQKEASDRCAGGLPGDLSPISGSICPTSAAACLTAKTCMSCLP